MATKSRKQKTTIRAEPPKSVADVMLAVCMDQITNEMCKDYAVGMFSGPKQLNEKERTAFALSLMHFASLGWTYYHSREEQAPTP